jgi:hypothetical protein
LRAPNTLELERDADAPAVKRWLVARGFIGADNGEEALSA